MRFIFRDIGSGFLLKRIFSCFAHQTVAAEFFLFGAIFFFLSVRNSLPFFPFEKGDVTPPQRGTKAGAHTDTPRPAPWRRKAASLGPRNLSFPSFPRGKLSSELRKHLRKKGRVFSACVPPPISLLSSSGFFSPLAFDMALARRRQGYISFSLGSQTANSPPLSSDGDFVWVQ